MKNEAHEGASKNQSVAATAAAVVIAVSATVAVAGEEENEDDNDYPDAAVIVIAEHKITFLRAMYYVIIPARRIVKRSSLNARDFPAPEI